MEEVKTRLIEWQSPCYMMLRHDGTVLLSEAENWMALEA